MLCCSTVRVGSHPPPLALVPRHRRVPGHGHQLCRSVSAARNSVAACVALQPNYYFFTPRLIAFPFRSRPLIHTYICRATKMPHLLKPSQRLQLIVRRRRSSKSTRNAATGSVPAGDPRGYARQPATPISPVICPRSSRPSRHVGCWPWALARSEKGEEIFPIISTSQMAGLGAGKTTRTKKLPWPGPS